MRLTCLIVDDSSVFLDGAVDLLGREGVDVVGVAAGGEDAIRLVLEDCAARGDPLPLGEPPRIREVTVTLAA